MSQQAFIAYLSRHTFSAHKWYAYEQIKAIVGTLARDWREYERMIGWGVEWLECEKGLDNE